MANLGLSEFPPLAKALAAALLVGGAASNFKQIKDALGLVAARATARPWTLLSCAFLSDSILTVSARYCRINSPFEEPLSLSRMVTSTVPLVPAAPYSGCALTLQ